MTTHIQDITNLINNAIENVIDKKYIDIKIKKDINENFESVSGDLPITDPSGFNNNLQDGLDSSGNYNVPRDKGQFMKQFNQDFDNYKKKVKERYKDRIKEKEETIYNLNDMPQDNYVLLSMGIILIVVGLIYLIFIN
jgi:hypothetical protein